MNHYTAKQKCALAADGKTLVAYDDDKANSLFAGSGAVKTESEVQGLSNVSTFFTREGGESEKTHEAAPASTRVIAEAPKASAKPTVIKK